jgi:LysM repeat protein
MDRARVWIVRVVAPALFVAAAIALVVVVQRALDRGSSSSTSTVAVNPATFEVTTEAVVTTDTTAGGEPRFYRVRRGDTLESIAARYNTTVDALTALNKNLDPLALQPGQRIRVA